MRARRARKTQKLLRVITVILVISIILAGGLYVYVNYFAEDNRHVGVWQREIDLTDYVADSMCEWLKDSVPREDIDFGKDKVTVSVKLTMSAEGAFVESINEESYQVAQKQAMKVAAAGLNSFLERRLELAGTSTAEVGKSVDELIFEALGESGESYLKEYGPKLLPTLEELKADYDVNGFVEVAGGEMHRTVKNKSINEKYLIQGEYLFLLNEVEDRKGSGSMIETIDGGSTKLEMHYDYPAMYKKIK